MTNTTKSFPSTVNYVPGEQLDGSLRLTEGELAQVAVAVFWTQIQHNGAAATFYTREVEFNPNAVELVFSVAPESVEVVAPALLSVLDGFDLL